ncbi:sugar ABC transporter permease [uncultured Martelella sp.]|uniref:carbohydrate ABC transporter permease n=1 Tax=uncultured Martelella sp. TaxID=392331 RepID=UPI0029C69733|nr:sugar ABC transporter permease [uncultured Martelella sp.]
MNLAAISLWIIGIVWIGGGSIWLLTTRAYRPRHVPVFLMDLMGSPVEFVQKRWGRNATPYPLLLPNMLIFGLFTFVPLALTIYVSMTSGDSIRVFSRPWVGLENYLRIFDCVSILDPGSCSNEGYAFWSGMFNTLIYVVIQVPVLLVVSLLTAIVVNKAMAGRGFWRAMFFYPVMLSPVVIANIWHWALDRKGALNFLIGTASDSMTELSATAYFDLCVTMLIAFALMISALKTVSKGRNPSLGWAMAFSFLFFLVFWWSNVTEAILPDVGFLTPLVGVVLVAVLLWLVATARPGVGIAMLAFSALAAALLLMIQFDSVFNFGRFRPINWLVTPNTGWPMFWLVLVYTWSHMGFYMLILLAGLQAIPSDLYEAARMDGTRSVRIFSRITVPLMMPTIIVVLVLTLIRCFQMFDEAYLLTGGGPGRETQMIVQTIYQTAFGTETPDYGIAAAGSLLMALVIGVFALTQLFLTRRHSGF